MATVQGMIGRLAALETAGFGFLGGTPATVINLLSAVPVDPKTLLLTFDRAPAGTVLAPASYVVSGPPGAAPIAVRSIALGLAAPGAVYPVTVYLRFFGPGTAGAIYTVTAATSIAGAGGESLVENSATWTATGYALDTLPGRIVTDPLRFASTPARSIITYEMLAEDPFGPQTDIRHLAMLTFGTDKRCTLEELPSDQRGVQFPDCRGWMLDPAKGTRLWAYVNKPLSNAWDFRVQAMLREDLNWWLTDGIVAALEIVVSHDSRGRYIELEGTYPTGEPFNLAVDELWRRQA